MASYFVDPNINANSGAGTLLSPYGDLQYALNQTTIGTYGTRFNIKAGTAEVLTAALSFTTHGGYTNYQTPISFRGYTSAEDDGGIGEIDCNSYTFCAHATDCEGITLTDLEVHNSGSNHLLHFYRRCNVTNCELHNTGSAYDTINTNAFCIVTNCNIHNVGHYGILVSAYGLAANNYIWHDTQTMTAAMYGATATNIINNIIVLDGETMGIDSCTYGGCVIGNSILQLNTGTGKGYDISYGAGSINMNNLGEGLSEGFEATIVRGCAGILHNAMYNCTTPYNMLGSTTAATYNTNNETLTSSPFAKSGTRSFANRFNYFAPLKNVWGTAWPDGCRIDKGAVQHRDAERSNVFIG